MTICPMCGRFTLRTAAEPLRARLGLAAWPEGRAPAPRYNIAPTQSVLCLRAEGPAWLQFGLVPASALSPKGAASRINARSETVFKTPSFRGPVRRRRCLVLSDGFYEWKRLGGQRQAYHFRLESGALFAYAGVWERWEEPGYAPIESCAVLTTAANACVAPVHERMPVILREGAEWAAWLDPGRRERASLTPLFSPLEAEALVAVAVGPRVNSAAHDDPACLLPARAKTTQLGFGF